MSDPGKGFRTPRSLRRYILDGERIAVATRLHWARLLEPLITTFAVTVIAAWLHASSGSGWFWVLWLVAAGRLAYRWLQWYVEWFVATDKRLVLAYGVIVQKVAMMPLMKVTDMGYSRTPLGQVIGYGRFTMESAGQDQALRQIDYVPTPDRTYRTLCDTMFFKPGAPPPDRKSPPSVVPGPQEPAASTAEIPVVDQGAHGGANPPDLRPGPSSSSQAGGEDDRRPTGLGGRKLWPSWTPPRRRSPYDPPESAGAGSHVPDPFL
ncbi:PH domain-containing protein [Isoptericola jiangsuensis]|uniref:PH domain-containing protein n=1 Tax=Isoptericola jiangsuensis TaxID=548579 RepID=UPI003AADD807